MALRLQIVSRHRQSLGERGFKEFGQTGGTIGRSLESNWVLPDGQRFLSSRHASIDFRSGSYYIIDTSTNGVYINGAEQPVGRGKPQRLFSGDSVRIGEYEMLVEIDEIDSTREQMTDFLNHVDPVDRKQRVDAPDPTGRDLIDAFEVTGVGIEMELDEGEAATLAPLSYKFRTEDLRLEGESAPAQPPSAKVAATSAKRARSAGPPKPGVQAAAAPKQATAASTASSKRATGTYNLDAFFRGAGMQPRQLDDKEAQEVLHRLGQLLREMIVGLSENLHLRSAQKNTLRQSNTTIQPQGNNSLKFSAGVDEALGNLFFRESEQYLDAVESIRESFGDIKLHQQALMKALPGAISDYIGRLDPEILEEKFSNGRHGVLMGAANRLKYWDLFKDLYQVVAQQNPGELPQLFLEEISRAYELETTRAAGPHPGRKLKAGAG